MTRSHLRVAYGDQPSRRTTVLSEILRNQGHEVIECDDLQSLLSEPGTDIYLLGLVRSRTGPAGSSSSRPCAAPVAPRRSS